MGKEVVGVRRFILPSTAEIRCSSGCCPYGEEEMALCSTTKGHGWVCSHFRGLKEVIRPLTDGYEKGVSDHEIVFHCR